MEQEGCTLISFFFVKVDSRAPFTFESQTPLSRIIVYYCSRKISHPKQSLDEIVFFSD